MQLIDIIRVYMTGGDFPQGQYRILIFVARKKLLGTTA